MLGLVTVVLGLGFLGLRVLSRLGFSRFSCGMVGFRDFQRLQVLFGQGISQGQFRFRGVEVCLGFRVLMCLGCARFSYGWLGFVVLRHLEVFSCQGISQGQLRFCRVGFFRVQSSFLPRVGQVYLRLGRVQCFLPFRGLFLLGYILGLVTVVQGCFVLGFRVLLRLGLARFAYGWVGFRVFQRLEVFSGQGIHQGQLRLCRVEVFQGVEFFCAQGQLGLLTVGQGLGFFSVQMSFPVRVYLRVSYGFLGFRFF